MGEDLDMGIEIIGVETVREHDGLAMSSRNQRLNPDQRGAAVVVPRSLDLVATAAGLRTSCSTDIGTDIGTGTTGDTGDTEMLSKLRRMAVTMIDAEPLAELEYFEIVDPTTLRRPVVAGGPLLALAAVWFGGVRLIDNRVVR
jgi:pantoate--beta-alanine ligase